VRHRICIRKLHTQENVIQNILSIISSLSTPQEPLQPYITYRPQQFAVCADEMTPEMEASSTMVTSAFTISSSH
jgi:hypothetical protein